MVEYSNYVFIGIFTLEMILKLLAEGFLCYIKDAFNVFDGFIVIMRYDAISINCILSRLIMDNMSTIFYFQFWFCSFAVAMLSWVWEEKIVDCQYYVHSGF